MVVRRRHPTPVDQIRMVQFFLKVTVTKSEIYLVEIHRPTPEVHLWMCLIQTMWSANADKKTHAEMNEDNRQETQSRLLLDQILPNFPFPAKSENAALKSAGSRAFCPTQLVVAARNGKEPNKVTTKRTTTCWTIWMTSEMNLTEQCR
jgi:hypothetical protein